MAIGCVRDCLLAIAYMVVMGVAKTEAFVQVGDDRGGGGGRGVLFV